jgi:hypothetical protein
MYTVEIESILEDSGWKPVVIWSEPIELPTQLGALLLAKAVATQFDRTCRVRAGDRIRGYVNKDGVVKNSDEVVATAT